ncbi:MAG: T9SS type A sorting domain-containing protein [Chitinophagales bacterium]
MMNTFKIWLIFLFAAFQITTVSGQNVILQSHSNQLANPDFLSGSSFSFYSILEGNFNHDAGQFDTLYFSDDLLNTIAELDLTNFRFPGGTISQFYHFNGDHGYGTSTHDLFCRPDYFPVKGFAEKVKSDSLYPVNFIHSYVNFIQQLEEKQGKPIGTHYVLNIMTHFFNGDFFPYNLLIDDLIEEHALSLAPYLNQDMADLDSAMMEAAAETMLHVISDPVMVWIVNDLASQNGFLERFSENIGALQFLIQNGLSIKGVEMGNENYAYTMLQDDDLSEIPFDCTTPDSIAEQYGTIMLPLRAYMQAIIKYVLITSMYNEVIKDIWDIPTGIVISGVSFGVKTLELDAFEIIEYTNANAKYHELWNKFIGRFDFYDAAIPHLYHKGLPDCEIFDALSKEELSVFIKNRINFYFKEVIPWQLERITAEIGHQPLWVTEWNINGAGAFGNTFAHAGHTYRFLNELNRYQDQYHITQANYHLTYALDHNQFALIRTRDMNATGSPTVIKQSMYHAFDYISKTDHEKLQLTDFDPAVWMGENYVITLDHHFWLYMNNDQTQLTLHFINQAESDLILPIQNVRFQIQNDSSTATNKKISQYNIEWLDAESMFSSNKGCSDYPDYFDDYTFIDLNDIQDPITLPAYSLGKITFELINLTTSVNSNTSTSFNLFPNPCDQSFSFQTNDQQNIHTIEIIDALGKKQKEFTPIISNKYIPTQDLANGLYTVLFMDYKGRVIGNNKIIVNHK